jgi:hypothetical protein
VSVLLDPDARPRVDRQPTAALGPIGRIMKAVRNLARFAYDLLNDLF